MLICIAYEVIRIGVPAPFSHCFFDGFCEDILQPENGRTEQSMRGAEMADAPYRCQPFPAPLHSRVVAFLRVTFGKLIRMLEQYSTEFMFFAIV